MKNIISLLVVITFIVIACDRKNIELQQNIENQIAEIENIIELNSIKISTDPIPENQLDNDVNAFKEDESYNRSFFDSLTIEPTILFPNSFFRIDYDSYKLARILGY